MHRARNWPLLVLVAFAAGCAAPMTLPKEFVELKDPGDGFRAVTSDDARLRVRDLAEPTEGGVDFWIETMRLDLVQQRGYEQVADGEVKNRDGDGGRWFQFAANVQGERVGFFVAVWVVDPWWRKPFLRVVEFAADRKSTRLNSSHSRASRMPSSA